MNSRFNIQRRVLTAILVLLIGSTVVFAGSGDFLPSAKAFPLAVKPAHGVLKVSFSIAPGYALYRKRMTISPVKAKNIRLGSAAWPEPIVVQNPFTGKELMYRGKVSIRIPFVCATKGAHRVQLNIRFQGCADAGLCYPPIEKKVHLSLKPASC